MVPMHVMTAQETKAIPTHFRAAGATEPGKAIRWKTENPAQQMLFKRLVDKGALVEMRPGTWYLNEEKLAASGGAQAALVVMLALGAILAGALLFLTAL